MKTLYPWQQTQWQSLVTRIKTQRLPQALLLQGIPGLGKTSFAHCLAEFLLCAQPVADQACGQCVECIQIQAGTHPDYHVLAPEKEHGPLSVEQIRSLTQALVASAHRGGKKLVIITAAERLNEAAANALLKTLEEPGAQCFFVLVSSFPSLLLPTIRSRCESCLMSVPNLATVIPWLSKQYTHLDVKQWSFYLTQAEGAPLAALALTQNSLWQKQEDLLLVTLQVACGQASAVTVANQWQEEDVLQILKIHLRALALIVRAKTMGGLPNAVDWPCTIVDNINCLAQVRSFVALFALIDHCYEKLKQCMQHNSINKRLLFENLLLNWMG